jgi:hypothetical protein
MAFERIKKLYLEGKIKSLENYVKKGIITAEQAYEIMSSK